MHITETNTGSAKGSGQCPDHPPVEKHTKQRRNKGQSERHAQTEGAFKGKEKGTYSIDDLRVSLCGSLRQIVGDRRLRS